MNIYTERSWECTSCGATGSVLFHLADSPSKRIERLEQSHKAKRRRDRCSQPNIQLVAQTEETR